MTTISYTKLTWSFFVFLRNYESSNVIPVSLLKLNISKIIFSSPSGKMDTDFFTFCLILKRKKNNKNLLWWGSNPQTLGLKFIVVTTTLLMIWLVPMHANIKSLKNVCYMSVHDGCYINRSRFCWFLVQIVEFLSSETYYITL